MEVGRRMLVDDLDILDRVLFIGIRSLLVGNDRDLRIELFPDPHLVKVAFAVSPVFDDLYK